MRAVGLLLLLLVLCGSGAQGELQETETTKTTTSDIWAEMRALRDMTEQLHVYVELLQRENSDLQTRLSSSESELLTSKSKIETLMSLETRLTATESKTSRLETKNTETKIAFYTGLTDDGYVGPFSSDTTLTYSKVFTNIGNAYNPSTGSFTAPVRGAYYFQFTMCNVLTGHMGVKVYKNNQRIMLNLEIKEETSYEYMTNSVILELMAGDEIRLVLPSGFSLFDDSLNQNTFSGSLLFTL
ncbi:complement C1q-like protein 2 [Centropristis striata]|uniref:complement C1q-like protein 2 n=1 Tax=Centropristis striata TaxID=184440 RepID=UPI0027DEB101|nr:complement C1q-like protein 2 [Centropristis striata]